MVERQREIVYRCKEHGAEFTEADQHIRDFHTRENICEECGKKIKENNNFLIIEIMTNEFQVENPLFSLAFCSYLCLGRYAKKKRKVELGTTPNPE